MQAPRVYQNWLLLPPHDPHKSTENWVESASISLLRELLVRHAEIRKIGRSRFHGTLQQKNQLWKESRNYLRQAISNFDAAMQVPNRSACLLYYYSMLNFAKAELLNVQASAIVNRRIRHGLSFSPTKARTIRGDSLVVQDGVFKLLYEHRTGHSIKPGTRLRIVDILANVPEISTQLEVTQIATSRVRGLLQMIALTQSEGWVILAMPTPLTEAHQASVNKAVSKLFQRTNTPVEWRNHFALSRRHSILEFYESKEIVPLKRYPNGDFNIDDLLALTWKLHPILGLTTDESWDAWVAPYVSSVPMPPSLARYALTYYASSLVRYRPSMFDADDHPEQAYLFDAIARECARPMLIDTLCGIEDTDHFFYASGSLRN